MRSKRSKNSLVALLCCRFAEAKDVEVIHCDRDLRSCPSERNNSRNGCGQESGSKQLGCFAPIHKLTNEKKLRILQRLEAGSALTMRTVDVVPVFPTGLPGIGRLHCQHASAPAQRFLGHRSISPELDDDRRNAAHPFRSESTLCSARHTRKAVPLLL